MSEQRNQIENLHPHLEHLQRIALIVGVLGLVICVVGAFWNRDEFYQSYLFAYTFWFGLALGSFATVMLSYLTGGRWGVILRRFLEAGALTLPLMFLLFIPFFFGLQVLYTWARPGEIASSEVLQEKVLYLNPTFFILRAVIYFVLWSGLALLLRRWSLAQDQRYQPARHRRMQLFSGLGLVLYAITLSLAATDWIMSLDYSWYSTIYGMLFVASQGLTTLAFMVVVLAILARRPPWSDLFKAGLFHDLGSLIFTFVILWAYMSFSQYLIIWSGNLAEEVPWYVRRSEGGWSWVAAFLMIFHFALPFFLLLSRRVKTSARLLTTVAIGILLARFVDLYWLIEPEFRETVLGLTWMHPMSLVGIGGIWIAFFIWFLQRRPLLPLHDPGLQAALDYE